MKTEETLCYAKREMKTDAGKHAVLEYRILIEYAEVGGTALELYGLEIQAEIEGKSRSRALRGITSNAGQAAAILDYLSRGCVFPEELEELTAQILEEKIL